MQEQTVEAVQNFPAWIDHLGFVILILVMLAIVSVVVAWGGKR